jgi:two-component system, OmpR family, sensor histidine kinase KdpD
MESRATLFDPPSRGGLARDAWLVAALLAAATAASLSLGRYASLTSVAMLYVLAVAVASYAVRLSASIACALGAVALLNFFFIPPHFSFRVDAQENVATLLALLCVAVVISHLGTAMRRQAEAARLNALRALQLEQLATELAGATFPAEILLLCQRFLSRAFAGPCLAGLLRADRRLDLPADTPPAIREGLQAAADDGRALGAGTERWPDLDAWFLPLASEGHVGGAACVRHAPADEGSRQHAQAICALAGQALWRVKLRGSIQAAEKESQWHQAQNTFLAAISHDFRTPLAAIVAAASSLQTQGDRLAEPERRRLLAVILDENGYLSNLTENTLQLARLENAGEIQLDWQSIEEIVGSVLSRVRRRDPKRRIQSRVPGGLPLIKADPVLLAQLLENLLDNALKYSEGAIELVVDAYGGSLQLAVHDRGEGIAPGDEQSIFRPFRRSDHAGRRGAGLGLAVCRAISNAHGGELLVRPREGGGSSFVLRLPLEAVQPAGEPA